MAKYNNIRNDLVADQAVVDVRQRRYEPLGRWTCRLHRDFSPLKTVSYPFQQNPGQHTWPNWSYFLDKFGQKWPSFLYIVNWSTTKTTITTIIKSIPTTNCRSELCKTPMASRRWKLIGTTSIEEDENKKINNLEKRKKLSHNLKYFNCCAMKVQLRWGGGEWSPFWHGDWQTGFRCRRGQKKMFVYWLSWISCKCKQK